ncbi:hypothetical protein DFP72DRAFT_1139518 [Ephemerocybe angulata]|uniref:Uncharacterized protein n=1 Tax=Ephemerocybe angulata TaxID=980116 RepID=A0A8H6HR16_9AGAR|nr:hypothetical protein DFP72DRAFT_1139518 [Tulosesus angulatus]
MSARAPTDQWTSSSNNPFTTPASNADPMAGPSQQDWNSIGLHDLLDRYEEGVNANYDLLVKDVGKLAPCFLWACKWVCVVANSDSSYFRDESSAQKIAKIFQVAFATMRMYYITPDIHDYCPPTKLVYRDAYRSALVVLDKHKHVPGPNPDTRAQIFELVAPLHTYGDPAAKPNPLDILQALSFDNVDDARLPGEMGPPKVPYTKNLDIFEHAFKENVLKRKREKESADPRPKKKVYTEEEQRKRNEEMRHGRIQRWTIKWAGLHNEDYIKQREASGSVAPERWNRNLRKPLLAMSPFEIEVCREVKRNAEFKKAEVLADFVEFMKGLDRKAEERERKKKQRGAKEGKGKEAKRQKAVPKGKECDVGGAEVEDPTTEPEDNGNDDAPATGGERLRTAPTNGVHYGKEVQNKTGNAAMRLSLRRASQLAGPSETDVAEKRIPPSLASVSGRTAAGPRQSLSRKPDVQIKTGKKVAPTPLRRGSALAAAPALASISRRDGAEVKSVPTPRKAGKMPSNVPRPINSGLKRESAITFDIQPVQVAPAKSSKPTGLKREPAITLDTPTLTTISEKNAAKAAPAPRAARALRRQERAKPADFVESVKAPGKAIAACPDNANNSKKTKKDEAKTVKSDLKCKGAIFFNDTRPAVAKSQPSRPAEVTAPVVEDIIEPEPEVVKVEHPAAQELTPAGSARPERRSTRIAADPKYAAGLSYDYGSRRGRSVKLEPDTSGAVEDLKKKGRPTRAVPTKRRRV